MSIVEASSQALGLPSKEVQVEKTKFTEEEAVDVWLRHFSGQHQHHIAADYRINAGRVSEIRRVFLHGAIIFDCHVEECQHAGQGYTVA
jgi:hypothetical protein